MVKDDVIAPVSEPTDWVSRLLLVSKPSEVGRGIKSTHSTQHVIWTLQVEAYAIWTLHVEACAIWTLQVEAYAIWTLQVEA